MLSNLYCIYYFDNIHLSGIAIKFCKQVSDVINAKSIIEININVLISLKNWKLFCEAY